MIIIIIIKDFGLKIPRMFFSLKYRVFIREDSISIFFNKRHKTESYTDSITRKYLYIQ